MTLACKLRAPSQLAAAHLVHFSNISNYELNIIIMTKVNNAPLYHHLGTNVVSMFTGTLLYTQKLMCFALLPPVHIIVTI